MSRNPTSWEEYQYGTGKATGGSHRGSVSSAGGRSIRFQDQVGSPSAASNYLDIPADEVGASEDVHAEGDLRRRRSSIALRFNTLSRVGGVNSIENFARSWTRAAAFHEVTPHRPSLIFADTDTHSDDEEDIRYGRRTENDHSHGPRQSFLQEASGSPENAIDDESVAPDNDTPVGTLKHKESMTQDYGGSMASHRNSMRERGESIFAIAPHLATPLVGSYGTSYGTLHSTVNEPSMAHAAYLWREQQAKAVASADDRPPLIVREIEQDGKVMLVVDGQSTLPQTIFNSTNVLIGIGLLSLPMGIKYAGWICGMIFLALSAAVTAYTAKLLAKCMDVDPSLITFADLAFISFGERARVATSVLFTIELLAACVALVVLFADTLDLLIPGVGVNEWKILCGLLLIPLQFAPMRMLSFTSVIGIFSCFSIVLIVFIDGLIKPHTPGSLREPATTYLTPQNWLTLPLSFGLLMSPWGGHSVFPSIYRDMRHPQKFHRAVKTTFTFTYILDCATAVVGILMFGDGVATEITANLLETEGYPRMLTIFISIFIAIIPLTKVPLNARPIVSTVEVLGGLDPLSVANSEALTGLSNYTRGILKVIIRVVIIIIFVIIAIVFPAFDSIMAFMGSTLCFTICVILPLMFYLKIFGKDISMRERLFDYFLIVVSSALAIVGTIWAFLPKSMIGAE